MKADESIGLAIRAIGEGKPDDYVISPTSHAREFSEQAPALAEILSSSAVSASARLYEDEDKDALQAQNEFKRVFDRSNLTVFGTGVFVALFMAVAATSSVLPGWVEKTLLVVLSLGGVLCGAFASRDLLTIRKGGLLETWMSKRALAETRRLDYFCLVTGSSGKVRSKTESPLENLKLEYFRRFQLDVQRAFYRERAKDHREEARKTLSYSGWAVFGAAIATGSAGVLGAGVHAGLAAIGGLGAIFTGLSSFSSMREAVYQSRRNAERYERTYGILEKLTGRLDAVRQAISAGRQQALCDFVEAVHEQLSLEHRQWLGDLSEARGAFARLENTLKKTVSAAGNLVETSES